MTIPVLMPVSSCTSLTAVWATVKMLIAHETLIFTTNLTFGYKFKNRMQKENFTTESRILLQ